MCADPSRLCAVVPCASPHPRHGKRFASDHSGLLTAMRQSCNMHLSVITARDRANTCVMLLLHHLWGTVQADPKSEEGKKIVGAFKIYSVSTCCVLRAACCAARRA